ncbi:MAG: phosphomannomutase/phosphoglucomutase, partial [Gammaproteobacteria bacterium]|nr:phosphomannomutase/phosphoglucomutase [Gammaproteobacteria bacterium]MBT3866895.1 phosphomannomutase/phosphoglucomutase [Gammaproteobacteria bacterium]
EDIARQIGLAIGSEAGDRGEQSLLVGYDGREYSPALAEALIEGIASSGRDVLNIGSVPTPVLYYATSNSDTKSGVMVTGSHNAPDHNGFKVVLEGKSLVDHEISGLFQRLQENNFSTGRGTVFTADFTQEYIDAISYDVVVAQPLKVVIDCGNGIAGGIAPELLDILGCETVPLHCEVDGSFPNHYPDPTRPENLKDLIATVQSQGADLGIALDGDGNRLVAVTAEGQIVWPDRLLMLFAKDIVSRNPGSGVVYDVKCTRHLNSVISGLGGRPIICRSGHSFIKQKIADTDALLGGGLSGHICFSERWFGFDDGLYSAARLLEIVGSQGDSLADLLANFPRSVATPEIHVAVKDREKFSLIETLVETADFEDAALTTIDGLRVDFADGWGLVRASNTEPALTLRFEADSDESLENIKNAFRELLQEVKSDLNFE